MIDNRTIEKVAILAGERGSRGEAAARLKHLQALVQNVPAEPKAQTVTAAPTMEQYNALLEDVRTLHAAFNALRVLLR